MTVWVMVVGVAVMVMIIGSCNCSDGDDKGIVMMAEVVMMAA